MNQAKNEQTGESPSVSVTQQADSNQQTDPTNIPKPTGDDVQEVSPTASINPSPTISIAPTDEPTPTDEPEPTPTEVVEVTETPTPVPTMEPEPTTDITGKPTNTPTPTKAVTPKPTNTPTPTVDPYAIIPVTPTTMWIKGIADEDYTASLYEVDPNPSLFTPLKKVGTIKQGEQVTLVGKDAGDIREIVYNGNHYWMRETRLSSKKVEPKWSEPREMKDAARMLMAKVNAYRESQGLRKFEDPYVYYDTTDTVSLGDYQYSKALKWAKSSCLAQTADHTGGQIGAGWYTSGGPELSKHSAEEIANQLFQSWKNSPGHNANMLQTSGPSIPVAKMVVVEYFDGTNYRYCAVMSFNFISHLNLPEGLE